MYSSIPLGGFCWLTLSITNNSILLLLRLKQLEKKFVLDCVPLGKLANDEVGRTQPSLNIGIPQYSAIKDPSCKSYFKSKGIPKAAREASSKKPMNDIESESSFERFLHNSSAQKYLDDRKKFGAGMSTNQSQ